MTNKDSQPAQPPVHPADKNKEDRKMKCMAVASEVLALLRDADIRMVDEDYVLRLVLQKLEMSHTMSFDSKIFKKIRKVIQSEFANYKGKLFLELDNINIEFDEEDESETVKRDRQCHPLALDALRKLLETSIHADDVDFVTAVAEDAAKRIFIGLLKLDIDLIWKMVKDSLASHEETILEKKFGKPFTELTVSDVDKILKEEEDKK